MNIINFIKTHKMSILSVLLVAAAAALGADSAFAMAVDTVTPADAPNPSDEANGGIKARPAAEQPKADLTGVIKSQMNGKAATATDVRDAGLEAEDYDEDVVLFNKFKYASETILASQVKPIKVNSYVVEHFRVGQPDLDTEFVASSAFSVASLPASGIISIPVASFDSKVDALIPYSTVQVVGVAGYTKDASGTVVKGGSLQLFVEGVNGSNIDFRVCNGKTGAALSIPTNTKFVVCATAAAESQMRVDPVTFLPEKTPAYLQKKIETCIITDAFKEQSKKTPLGQADVIKYTTDIFKRKCARSHWMGEEGRFDVKVKETGNREAVYFEKGILRQIPMMYTHGATLTTDDLMAISSMMFTEWAQSDKATAFVGKKEMKRIMKLVNSAQHVKDASTVEVNNYGIKVRKYTDNFGEISFVYDQTLDELGYTEAMVVLDLSSMVRYYMREEKTNSQDMKKTGEAREAEVWNISRIDCYCLKGGNALIACPTAFAAEPTKLGGITAWFKTTNGLASETDHAKKYYIATKDSTGFEVGSLVEWDAELNDWKNFDGRIFVNA